MLTFTTRTLDAQAIPSRQELRADVAGGDGLAEVTFALERASRPGQYELLGTSDHPPYRVFWRPPADLEPGDTLRFIATVDDLRGHRASTAAGNLRVAPSDIPFGIKGAKVPLFTLMPAPDLTGRFGAALKLTAAATGTGPLEFSWLHDGATIKGATGGELTLGPLVSGDAGHYTVLAHNAEGTAISRDTVVSVAR